MIQPRPSTFWRLILGVLLLLSLLAYQDLFDVVERLNIELTMSRSWMALFIGLSIFTVFILYLFLVSFTGTGERFAGRLESLVAIGSSHRWLGGILLWIGLSGFALLTASSSFFSTFRGQDAIRYLVFFLFCLLGMWGMRLIHRETPWMAALLVTGLLQSLIQLFLVHFPMVSAYPFARGWSETSRFYFPSLFLSGQIYGQEVPWPILHPSLHILLAPPYLFDAPLWLHRLWQVVLRFVLVGLIVPPLLARLSISSRTLRWLAGLGMFLFLFMGPVYFHLAVPVIIVLAGFSLQNERRTWAAVLVASIWCGWSRVNWYPVPGMIAAILYLLEMPVNGRSLWRYLSRPFLWFVLGTLVAFLSQRIYIDLSGIDQGGFFYTSLSSDLLWYRLLPNSTYFLGILPAALLASLPVWLVMYFVLRSNKVDQWHPLRLLLIFASLLVLFVGGILVSLKIGGGADLHNLDAYFVLLLIVVSYLVFARYRLENGQLSRFVPLPWTLVLALLIVPAWSWLRFNINFRSYEANDTSAVLQTLQERVDALNTQDGEILFITQRHLLSMHMLEGATLVPEYEREDLMEMAMGNNTEYLDRFRADMEAQRFDLIVVDPLVYNVISRNRSFSEENNVWVRRVMRHILCNYREDGVFPAHEIALYVPQEGERACPER